MADASLAALREDLKSIVSSEVKPLKDVQDRILGILTNTPLPSSLGRPLPPPPIATQSPSHDPLPPRPPPGVMSPTSKAMAIGLGVTAAGVGAMGVAVMTSGGDSGFFSEFNLDQALALVGCMLPYVERVPIAGLVATALRGVLCAVGSARLNQHKCQTLGLRATEGAFRLYRPLPLLMHSF
jgi:hypothetical protein